jgi:hypothetical protein
MADATLFIGWGPPVRGREAKGLEVFGEAIAFWTQRQDAGAIEGFDVVLLTPHGGDLNGFMLVKGSEEQIAALRDDEEFGRINTRAGLIVENFGVVEGVSGDAIGEQIGIYQQAIGDLT